MYRKKYVGSHGFNTWVRGVWVLDGEERYVRVTATGRTDDEFVVGTVYSLAEIANMTEGDSFAYAERAEVCAVA